MNLHKVFTFCSDQELHEIIADATNIIASRQKQYPLHNLDLSVRCINAFKHINLYTLNEISFHTEKELLSKGIGKMSMKEIKEQLLNVGISLKQE